MTSHGGDSSLTMTAGLGAQRRDRRIAIPRDLSAQFVETGKLHLGSQEMQPLDRDLITLAEGAVGQHVHLEAWLG